MAVSVFAPPDGLSTKPPVWDDFMTKKNSTTVKPDAQSRPPILPEHFKNANRAPYELAHLFLDLPANVSGFLPNEPETKDIAAAAEQHCCNGLTSVLNGLEAIGSLLVKVGCSTENDGLGRRTTLLLGDLIQHLAVEAQMLSELGEEMDRIAKGDAQ